MTVLVEYVAPARWLLDELHRPDPDWPPGTELGEETAGRTRCGLPMLASDLWQPVAFREGDRVCRGCQGAAVDVPVQEALL